MFKFLKEKIKNTVKIFSKKVEEEIKTLEEVEKAKVRPEILKPLKKKEDKEEIKTLKDIEEVEAKKGIFSKVVEKVINNSLKESIEELFEVENYNLISKIREKKPYVIVFVGINGGGKTTSIAKIIKFLKNNKLNFV